MEAMDVKYRPAVFQPNGSVKKVVPAVAVVPSYRECLKNHAASMGGHALDGCGEFMPSLEVNPADPSSFKCAACGCHRNFHRRLLVESPSPSPPPPPAAQPQAALLPAPPAVLHGMPQRGEETPEDRVPAADDSESDSDGSEYDDERSVSPPQLPPPAHVPAPVAQQPPASYFPSPSPPPHMMLSLNSSAPPGAAHGQVQGQRLLPVQASPATAPPAHAGAAPARKRFRTKFTAQQKQRMQELSERLGWRLQKRDEAVVDEWCRDIGVSKGVFKVWMHNNKHNYLGGHSARRSASASSVATTPTAPAPAGPFHIAPAHGAPPPPFVPSVTHSSPAPTATGFNINGTAAAPTFTAVHQVNGTSSPQSA